MTQGFFPLREYPSDFHGSISRLELPGFHPRAVVMENPSGGGNYEDIWGAGGEMVYPVSAESWEILSDSPNDDIAGTGARQVIVRSLDINYNTQDTVVSMSGVTPVLIGGSHFRPDGSSVIAVGSQGFNDGTITIRSVGAGLVRQVIPAEASVSYDSHVTVPAGMTGYLASLQSFFSKGRSGSLRGRARLFGSGVIVNGGELPFFESSPPIRFYVQPRFPEKTDIWYQGLFDTAVNVPINAVYEIYMRDNTDG